MMYQFMYVASQQCLPLIGFAKCSKCVCVMHFLAVNKVLVFSSCISKSNNSLRLIKTKIHGLNFYSGKCLNRHHMSATPYFIQTILDSHQFKRAKVFSSVNFKNGY